jgi:hypothetical protein
MHGAIAISTCICRSRPSVPFTDAPPGFRPSLSPSVLPPQTTRHPQPTAPASKFQRQFAEIQLPQEPRNTKNHPQSLFRLERTPTLYFHQLTRILIEPMFRLDHRQRASAEAPKPALQECRIHSLSNILANSTLQQYNAHNDPKQRNNAGSPPDAES